MRNLFLIMLIEVCMLSVTSICFGQQQYYFKHYQTEDGLAHNSVGAVMQDSKGMIWVATRGGLNRFDGYNFKNFRNKNDRFGYLGNNVITALAEDKDGMLWIGTGRGIYRYDPFQEVFTRLESAPRAYISHLQVDRHNNLWFSLNSELHKYDVEQDSLQNLKIQASCLTIDERQYKLWVGNHGGSITLYDMLTGQRSEIQVLGKEIPDNLRSISKIVLLDGGKALIGCFKQGLKSYDLSTGKIVSLRLREHDNTDIYVRDIGLSTKSECWVATESGIYIYNLKTGQHVNLRKHADDPYALADNAVYSVYRDQEGGMWAGTFFGGLHYYSPNNARFKKYYPVAGVNSLSGNAVRELSPDHKGDLWIGTEDGGLNKMNLRTGIFSNFLSSNQKALIPYANIHGLLAYKNQLLFGPYYNGMEVFDVKRGLVTDRFKLVGEKDGPASDFVLSIYQTRDSTILVGTGYGGSGLFRFDPKKKTLTRVKEIPTDSYVFDVREDAKGNIWTGSINRGAYYYHPKTGVKGNIRFADKVNGKYRDEFAVHGIFEDKDHFMWFTTGGGGLMKVSPAGKIVKKFTVANGLPSNLLFRMLEDDADRLWISSLKGLICLDRKTDNIKVYTKANGLITDQFNFSSAYKDPQGKMYFGSVKGMIVFDPKDFEKTSTGPATYITGFQVNNKDVVPGTEGSPLQRSVFYSDTIVLSYLQNNFNIEFAALNYASPEVTRYEYFMEGVDRRGTYLSRNRKAYFTDLSPGEYVFTVRAKCNVDSWIGKERKLYIKILPPYWQTSYAYAAYLLLIIGMVFFAVRYYHRYLERINRNKQKLFEHEKEKDVYRAKIEFFTNIAHEIQTPITLILGPIELMVHRTKDESIKKSLAMVQRNAKRLVELTSQLLDFRKTEIDQFGLNFVHTDIRALLKEQVMNFVPEAEKKGIELTMDLPMDPLEAFADKEALVKIFSNLLSNAVKYAFSKAHVRLFVADGKQQTFTVLVCNDGKGIPLGMSEKVFEPFFRMRGNSQPGTGIGLSLAKSLTELHNGTLRLLPSDEQLVLFELQLPMRQKFEFKLSSWKKM
ncbi:ligand-binding sensor domain-containing protein [Sphingobacterium bambusae]|uniref:histidine kinase n=1 Tax=Sphingobacterium bambusae TaxID=662858 RepID=A0ABW6BFF1_9SPHI|nr:two-component regulator propeller domain-containing protein [Sphingobacterium bambusae]WPL49563.1 two-component regulator propeller domain-containing protein [Sphingobacterium bambusae]